MTEQFILTPILCKASFSALAFTMLYYWMQMSFHFFEKNNKIGFFGIFISNSCLTLLLLSRWLESNHFPFTNLFESLLLLCWILTSIHLTFYTFESFKGFEHLLGVLISPLTLFLNAFATFCLPEDLQKSTVLVPALQSNWLVMHVSVMILSYGFLLCGSLLALGYIICNKIFILKNSSQKQVVAFYSALPSFLPLLGIYDATSVRTDTESVMATQQMQQVRFGEDGKGFSSVGETGNWLLQGQIAQESLKNKPVLKSSTNLLLAKLDNGSYRCIGLGFAFLTLGILSGAVWANEAWGSYWSWDPKETWALITWIIYALYMHVRLIKGWSGQNTSFVAIFGFFSVWLCYLGVNLLGSGLHSYGWVS